MAPSKVAKTSVSALRRANWFAGQVALSAARLAAGLQRIERVAGRGCLEPGCAYLQLAPVGVGNGVAADQVAHGEGHRVGARKARQEFPLQCQVVQDRDLGSGRGAELTAPGGVAHRDHEGLLRHGLRSRRDADPARDEGAQHGEEAAAGAGDGTVVAALGTHLGEAVQKRVSRHPHPVEPDAAVVDPVQPFLRPAVLNAHAGKDPAAGVPDGDQEGVDAVVVEGGGGRGGCGGLAGMVVRFQRGVIAAARHAQPGEDGGHAAVQRGVADVVLAGVVVRGGDHELGGRGVVGGGCAEVADVGAVTGLGHGVASGKFQRGDPGQVAAVVLLGPELGDAATEEPELHAVLDQHAQVGQRELLEDGHPPTRVALSAVLARVGHRAQTRLGQRPHRGEGALPVLVARNLFRDARLGTGEHGTGAGPQFGVVAVNERRDLLGQAPCTRPSRHRLVPLPGDVPERLRARHAQLQLHPAERRDSVVAPCHRAPDGPRRVGLDHGQTGPGQREGTVPGGRADGCGGRAEDRRRGGIAGVQPVAHPGPALGGHPLRAVERAADCVEFLVFHEAVGPDRAEDGQEGQEGGLVGECGGGGGGHDCGWSGGGDGLLVLKIPSPGRRSGQCKP